MSDNPIANRILFESFKKTDTDTMVIIIPGGPGLDARYMSHFSSTFAEKSPHSVILAHLPDHGTSSDTRNESLEFKMAGDLLLEAIAKIRNNKKLVLVGHSFGVNLALYLSAKLRNISKIIGIAPIPDNKFDESYKKASREALNDKNSFTTEEEFRDYFAKMLPFYFRDDSGFKQFSSEILMSSSWLKHGSMVQGMPTARSLLEARSQIPLSYLLPESDRLLDKMHFKTTIEGLANIDVNIIPEAGHFCVLENSEIVSEMLLKLTP